MTKTHRYTTMTGAALLMLMASTPAFAYLDPGTGSALIQGLLAALAGIAVTAKLYWHRLLRLLGLKKKQTSAQSDRSDHTPTQYSKSQPRDQDHS